MEIIKAARGRITGKYGARNVPGANVPEHKGIDIGHGNMTDEDRRVVAPAAGRVVAVGREGTYGLRVIIEHAGYYSSLLAHLASAVVKVGQVVRVRETIGVMGDSGGNWPVHSHQELRFKGVPVNPADHLVDYTKEEEMPLQTDVIEHDGIKAPAAVVLVNALRLGEQNAAKLDRIESALSDLGWIKHNGIDAPADVVEADQLVTAYAVAARLTGLEQTLATIAAAVGVTGPTAPSVS